MVRLFCVLSMDDYIAVCSGLVHIYGYVNITYTYTIIYMVVTFSTVFFSDVWLFLWLHWMLVAACGVAYELSIAV